MLKYILPILGLSLQGAHAPAHAENDSGGIEASVIVTDRLGGERTCAGELVYAHPVKKGSKKLIKRYYGEGPSGYISNYKTPEYILKRDRRRSAMDISGGVRRDSTVLRSKYKTECSETGTFAFSNLKAGEYYLIIPVFWQREDLKANPKQFTYNSTRNYNDVITLASNYRGGTFMVRVPVTAGENFEFLLNNEYEDEPEAE